MYRVLLVCVLVLVVSMHVVCYCMFTGSKGRGCDTSASVPDLTYRPCRSENQEKVRTIVLILCKKLSTRKSISHAELSCHSLQSLSISANVSKVVQWLIFVRKFNKMIEENQKDLCSSQINILKMHLVVP